MRVYYKQVQLNPTQETDYNDLANKPKINGVDLVGDLSTEQIKITWHGTQAEFDALPSVDPYTFYIIDDGIPVGMQESYLNLSDKPSINGQVLTGNKVSSDLNMYTSDEVDNIIASMRAIKVVTALPAAPAVNTMYYVGPDSEGVYMVYLFDSLLNRIDLGPSVQKLYTAGNAIGINETTSTISVKYDGTSIRTNTANELYVPELMGSEGSQTRPVYLDGGEIKAVKQVASGAYTSAVPFISSNGATDIGSIIDFHTPTSTTDYDARLYFDDSIPNGFGITKRSNSSIGWIPTTAVNADVGSQYKSVYVTNGTIVSEANPHLQSYQPGVFTSVSDLVDNLRNNSPGSTGSVRLTADSTIDGITISGTGVSGGRWYSYEWIPYSGGVAGGNTDGKDRGTLILTGAISNPDNNTYIVNYNNGTLKCRQLIDSAYINKYAPFTFSGQASGTGLPVRTYTDTAGRTYQIGFGWSGWRSMNIGGTGFSDAIEVHQTGVLNNISGQKVSSNIRFFELASGFYGSSFGRNGTTVVNSSWNGTTLSSGGWTEVPLFGNSVSYGSLYFDITWFRHYGDWWKFSGTFMTDNGEAVVTVAGNMQAIGSTSIPGIGYIASGDFWDGSYSCTVYHKNW